MTDEFDDAWEAWGDLQTWALRIKDDALYNALVVVSDRIKELEEADE